MHENRAVSHQFGRPFSENVHKIGHFYWVSGRTGLAPTLGVSQPVGDCTERSPDACQTPLFRVLDPGFALTMGQEPGFSPSGGFRPTGKVSINPSTLGRALKRVKPRFSAFYTPFRPGNGGGGGVDTPKFLFCLFTTRPTALLRRNPAAGLTRCKRWNLQLANGRNRSRRQPDPQFDAEGTELGVDRTLGVVDRCR